jgi:hypothetical protein
MSCTDRSATSAPPQADAETNGHGSSPNAVTADAMIYAAALDSLVHERGVMWNGARDSTLRVLDMIYWWPMVQLNGERGAALGPTPIALPAMAKRFGRTVVLTPAGTAGDADSTRYVDGPVFAFGPIDHVGAHEVLIRAAIYAARNGQELYQVRLRGGSEGWRVTALLVELQT